jgi:hypothetical protein
LSVPAIPAIPTILTIVHLTRIHGLECGFHQLSAGAPGFPLSLASTIHDLLQHLGLHLVDAELLDHILPEHNGGPLKLEVNLRESRNLPLIEDFTEGLLGALTDLVHGFAHHGKSRGTFGFLLTTISPIPAAAPLVLSETRGVGILRLSAAARILTETRSVRVLTLSATTATEAAAARIVLTVALGVGGCVLASALPLALWTTPWPLTARTATHLAPDFPHVLADFIAETLDLSLLLVLQLQFLLDGGVGCQHEQRAARPAAAETEPAETAKPAAGAAPAEPAAGRPATAVAAWRLSERAERQGRQGYEHRRCRQGDSQS